MQGSEQSAYTVMVTSFQTPKDCLFSTAITSMSSPSKSLSLSDPEQAGSWAHPSDRGQQVWRMGTQSGVAGTLDGAPPGPDGNLPAHFCLQLFPWGREATPHAVTAADGGKVSAPTYPVAPGFCLMPGANTRTWFWGTNSRAVTWGTHVSAQISSRCPHWGQWSSRNTLRVRAVEIVLAPVKVLACSLTLAAHHWSRPAPGQLGAGQQPAHAPKFYFLITV